MLQADCATSSRRSSPTPSFFARLKWWSKQGWHLPATAAAMATRSGVLESMVMHHRTIAPNNIPVRVDIMTTRPT